MSNVRIAYRVNAALRRIRSAGLDLANPDHRKRVWALSGIGPKTLADLRALGHDCRHPDDTEGTPIVAATLDNLLRLLQKQTGGFILASRMGNVPIVLSGGNVAGLVRAINEHPWR